VAQIETLFIDKGGVLIDNTTLSAQWRQRIGEFLAPRLGGTPAEWGSSNIRAFERQWARFQAAQSERGPADIRAFFANDARLWLLDMCDGVGIPRPSNEIADVLAAETIAYVKANLDIPVPHALEMLRALRGRGVVLHVASADSHDDLVELLERIGARDLFDRIYGSDLVKAWKFGPEYYRAVLADSGADPDRAAVVDDSPEALSWARECGLRGFLVERGDGESFDDAVTRTLEAVARAID
jgi:HAD superfamily hydrolase (TIGR01509 family)